MRDYEKFFTPPEVADYMTSILKPKAGDLILEPSAGQGSLVSAIKRRKIDTSVVAVEMDSKWRYDLEKVSDETFIQDFLTFKYRSKFNSCLANPPFGNETDLEAHINKMRELVMIGGKIVALVPLDFFVIFPHSAYPVKNWSANKDGSITPIKILEFYN